MECITTFKDEYNKMIHITLYINCLNSTMKIMTNLMILCNVLQPFKKSNKDE